MPLDEEIAGITCSEVLASLSDYLDGDLDDARRGQVEAHVATCRNCERFGGMLAAVVRGVRAHATVPGDPSAFERLRERLRGS